MKKQSKKKRDIKKSTSKKPVTENEQPAKEGFDFGGLPNRNLKKNLGC